jgi:hypothetical protein
MKNWRIDLIRIAWGRRLFLTRHSGTPLSHCSEDRQYDYLGIQRERAVLDIEPVKVDTTHCFSFTVCMPVFDLC